MWRHFWIFRKFGARNLQNRIISRDFPRNIMFFWRAQTVRGFSFTPNCLKRIKIYFPRPSGWGDMVRKNFYRKRLKIFSRIFFSKKKIKKIGSIFENEKNSSKNLKKIQNFLKIFWWKFFIFKNRSKKIRFFFSKFFFRLKNFQSFSIIVFPNHISSSRRTREKLFSFVLSNLTWMRTL